MMCLIILIYNYVYYGYIRFSYCWPNGCFSVSDAVTKEKSGYFRKQIAEDLSDAVAKERSGYFRKQIVEDHSIET